MPVIAVNLFSVLMRKLTPAEVDQNFSNLKDGVDTANAGASAAVATANSASAAVADKCPLAGPGSGQAFNVGALTATSGNIGVGTWVAPTLAGSWLNFNSGYAPVGYIKDSFGIVHLRGLAVSGANGSTIFILPVGFRPPYTQVVPAVINSAFGSITITAAGVVSPVGATGGVYLDGISFATF